MRTKDNIQVSDPVMDRVNASVAAFEADPERKRLKLMRDRTALGIEDCCDFEDEAIDALPHKSKELTEFESLLNELPEADLPDVLMYVKIIRGVRKSEGKIEPPSAELWDRLPYWLKMRIFLTAEFYYKVYQVKKWLLHYL